MEITTDKISSEKRRWNMSRIKSANTLPEIKVRRFLRSLRISYRKNYNILPGKPDIVILKTRKIIFVNGCFWHHHYKCKRATIPKSNASYWMSKFTKTIERDREINFKLLESGWKVMTIWECELKKEYLVKKKIKDFVFEQ